ncbi:Uma2 family endonuclease [Pseudonocardiaceae bacterium YIM PH 21723]|nr:Uma2 family endonuclease [Pseudonocardiaceae bacterium YIM PH 21723]
MDAWLDMAPPADGSRLELIYGHLYMSPAPSGEHQFAGYRLARLLEDALSAAGGPGLGLYVVPAVNVRISSAWRTALIPDVAVLTCPPTGASFAAGVLAAAVEIWSAGNSREERETKKAAYAAAGVPWLWTIEDVAGQVRLSVFQLGAEGYEQVATGTAAAPVHVPGPVPANLDLSRLKP